MVIEPLTMIRKYISEILVGFVVGIIGFSSWWLGYDFLSKIVAHTFAVSVLSWWMVSFLIYTITPLYKNREGYTNTGSRILSFIFYSFGICISFVVLLVVLYWGISQMHILE